MANNHGHGAFGAHLIEDRDLTPHTTAMSFTPSVDVAEDTGLSPLGDQKTYLQGLSGSAASSSGFALNEYEFLVAEMKNLTGTFRDIAPVTFGWFGFGLGKFLTMAQSRKTSFNIPVSNASTITTSISHQCDGTYRLGHSLLNPFGSSAYTGSETQLITFAATDATQVLSIRFEGRREFFDFTASDSNTTLKAGIETLLDSIPGLSAVAVTVTGSLTGSSTKTGTKSFAFSGTANIPALQIIPDIRFLPTTGFSDSGNLTEGSADDAFDELSGDSIGQVAEGDSGYVQTSLGTAKIVDRISFTGQSNASDLAVWASDDVEFGTYDVILSADNLGDNPQNLFTTQTTPRLYLRVVFGGSGDTEGPRVGGIRLFVPFAATVVAVNLSQGGTTAAKWNLLSATGSGLTHDGGATTATGFYCRLQVLLAAGTAFTVVVEHSDSSGSGFSALHTFTGVTDASNPALVVQEYSGASNLSVKRYVRYRITTITGTFAAFVGYARES